MTISIFTLDIKVDIFLDNRIDWNVLSILECGNCRSAGAKSNTGMANVVPK